MKDPTIVAELNEIIRPFYNWIINKFTINRASTNSSWLVLLRPRIQEPIHISIHNSRSQPKERIPFHQRSCLPPFQSKKRAEHIHTSTSTWMDFSPSQRSKRLLPISVEFSKCQGPSLQSSEVCTLCGTSAQELLCTPCDRWLIWGSQGKRSGQTSSDGYHLLSAPSAPSYRSRRACTPLLFHPHKVAQKS